MDTKLKNGYALMVSLGQNSALLTPLIVSPSATANTRYSFSVFSNTCRFDLWSIDHTVFRVHIWQRGSSVSIAPFAVYRLVHFGRKLPLVMCMLVQVIYILFHFYGGSSCAIFIFLIKFDHLQTKINLLAVGL